MPLTQNSTVIIQTCGGFTCALCQCCMSWVWDIWLYSLKPRHGYVPKVISAHFRAQVISLSALTASYSESDTNPLCPVRALKVYIAHSAPFRHSELLFVSFGGNTKGLAASKQSLSIWRVDAIAAALYCRSKDLLFPFRHQGSFH